MPPPHALHVVCASRRYRPLRTRTLLQFMVQRIPALPGFHAINAPTAIPTVPAARQAR
ncbi:hypothetical protein [Burkholderia metallica]|uniref:hypothetical protein n=1 Tax=Burkholderia metallica TaxID=488729 RepID=UPI001CF14ED6|nr:hypothetical protein [Burkholderia metallica]MCA8017159.1 hypothetical protein [Burkholderia metallica]